MMPRRFTGKKRCSWATGNDRLRRYHDREWGVPVHKDRKLFEYMVLDAFQAGLSWRTILDKRMNFRLAFDDFNPKRVARFTQKDMKRLLNDPGIVRNRLKIEATIANAKAFLKVKDEFGSFDAYIWRFVDGSPIQNRWINDSVVPARSKESDAMSKDLRARKFTFVGSVICYSFMQAAGLVNDHIVDCFRHSEIAELE